MKSFEAKLIDAIKTKREAEGLSIRALSGVVGISFSTLARIERGEGLPDNNSKIRLLEWLGENAEVAGLKFDNVAFVHFRAAKNVQSSTVQALLRAADGIRRNALGNKDGILVGKPTAEEEVVALSKEDLEKTAESFRKDLNLRADEPLDSLKLKIEGVEVHRLSKVTFLDRALMTKLFTDSCDEWSAMSVPIELSEDTWAVLLNDYHNQERQRVTILEEYWHILLGHKLTKIARIAEAYGRTYDKAEEHDAYFLASATLLPKAAVEKAVKSKQDSASIAKIFGTSPELVDYRIKRLGLWRDHVGKKVALISNR